MKIRIATRRSELALWQAEHVADRLRSVNEVSSVELIALSTRGDEILDRSLQKIGGKGLFIKELEIAMQRGEADIAVHSMKDVPADMPAGFCIGALLERANPSDALLTVNGSKLADLPQGARVGSSSLRRQAQLKAIRPDLVVQPLRGNVNTRIRKLQEGDFDAIVLASAGLERLGLHELITEQFTPRQMLPAAAQGVIGIECLDSQQDLKHILTTLEHPETGVTTAAERAVAARLQANCQSPVAAFATATSTVVTLDALVAHPEGSSVIRAAATAALVDAEKLGFNVADQLLEKGAARLLGEARS